MLSERTHSFACIIGDYDVGAGAFDACQSFQHYALLIDPALFGGGFDHRVLTGNMISGERQIKTVTHHLQDIEEHGCRLDHQEVCAFSIVQLSFAHRFARVCGVHLVSPAITERWGAVSRFAEWTIKS